MIGGRFFRGFWIPEKTVGIQKTRAASFVGNKRIRVSQCEKAGGEELKHCGTNRKHSFITLRGKVLLQTLVFNK